MNELRIDQYDTEENYCRMLGHYLTFKYCRLTREGGPCHKIKDCWFEKINIEAYLNQHFSSEEQEKILSPPQPKVMTILEMIQKAQKVQQEP